MELYEKIVYLRRKKGLSQQELADKLDISRQSVYKWEQGISYPEIIKLPELAKLFDVTVDDLLNDSIDLTVIKEEPVKKEQIVNRRSMLDYLLMIPIGLFFGILLFMFYVFGFMSVGFMFFFLASTIIGPLFGVFTLFIQDVLSFNYILMSIVMIIGSLGLIYPTFLLTFKWKDKYLELVKKVTKWLKNYNWKKVL